jgi:hypothetical protein
LLIVNSTISFIEENNAGNAAAALMAHLAPKTKVCLQHLFDLCQSCCQGVVKWAEPSGHGGQSWMRLSKTTVLFSSMARSLLKLCGLWFLVMNWFNWLEDFCAWKVTLCSYWLWYMKALWNQLPIPQSVDCRLLHHSSEASSSHNFFLAVRCCVMGTGLSRMLWSWYLEISSA